MRGGHPRPLTAAQQFLSLRINPICAGTGTLHAGRLVWRYRTSPTPLSREYEVRIDYRQGDVPTVFIDEPDLTALADARILFRREAFQDDEDWKSVRDSAVYKRLTRLRESGGLITAESQAALDEIAVRHPKWTPGREDRDDFVVWHESRWGPHGRPEDLAEVTDEALVAEATRLQRERQFDQGDVWRVLCGADPERAYRGLQSDARSRRWEPTAWRDLLWAAADKGDPALQFELTESLLEMPETTLAEVLEPAASWLQKRRETLKGEPHDAARFLRVWDRLVVLVYPREAVPPEQAEQDLVTTALNDPAGSLAWTFLDHLADKHLPPNSGFPSEHSTRLARAASRGKASDPLQCVRCEPRRARFSLTRFATRRSSLEREN